MNAGTACNADKGTVNENIILQDLNFNDGCIITFESSKFNEKLLKSRQNSKNPRDYISKLSKSDRWLMYLSRKLSKIELEVLNMEQIFAAASEQENTFFRNQKDYDAYLVQEIEESFTFEDAIRQRDLIIADKDKKLVEKYKKLVEKYKKLAEKDEKLAAKDGKLAEIDKKLAEINKMLAEIDKMLAEIDKKLAETDKKLAETDKKLAEIDKMLAEIDKILAEIDKILAEHDETIIRFAKYLKNEGKNTNEIINLTGLSKEKIDSL